MRWGKVGSWWNDVRLGQGEGELVGRPALGDRPGQLRLDPNPWPRLSWHSLHYLDLHRLFC